MSSTTSNLPEREYQIADLAVISYEKLLRKNPAEMTSLLSACVNWGFFYLDLGGSNTENYLETMNALFGVSKEYFARPLEEKLKDTKQEVSVYNICG